MEGVPARAAAAQLLQQVLVRRRPLDEALESSPALERLEQRDRGFARLLVATALRRLGQLDALIDTALEKPLPERAGPVRDVLRLGLVQLLFLGTAPHAAVSTSVALAQALRLEPFKALINAVLRRLAGEAPALLAMQDAARLNTPDWLWQGWVAAYGAAGARAIAEAHQHEAPLDITPKGDALDLARRLDAMLLTTGTLRRPPGGAVTELPGWAGGLWWVQDAAAALAAPLLRPAAGMRIADLCAGPGGKTAQLAASGATVTAVDRSPKRLGRVGANLARLGLTAELVEADAAEWRPAEPLDAVLLDPPCSSTGTIRRHPDIAHLKSADDVAKLATLQARLLEHAVTLVRPGGLLLWCTCSLEPAEGEQQIARLISAGAPVERLPIAAEEIGGWSELVTPLGEVRTLPSHRAAEGGLDGFHIARLRRRAS